MKIDTKGLPASAVRTLKKFGLIKSARGTIPEADIRWAEDGKPMGKGPLVDPTVIERLLAADRSPDKRWANWIFTQAGGGKAAQRKGDDVLTSMKHRWVEQHVRGGEDASGNRLEPVSKEEAEASWAEVEPSMRELILNADEDVTRRYKTIFGWFRNWPGRDNLYQKTASAVQEFWKLYRKIIAMNKWLVQNDMGDKVISTDPKDYDHGTATDAINALNDAMKRVKRFYSSRKARSDVRAVRIYEDENLRVVAPLTYAAAVKLGWSQWPFSDPEKFNKGLDSGLSSFEDAWKRGAQDNVYVFYHFKSPVPTWVSQDSSGRANRYYYTNLALEVPQDQLKRGEITNAKVYDEEGRKTTTLATVWDAIQHEPEREYDPEEQEFPINQGPPVYTGKEEADAVLDSLKKGTRAVESWGRSFDTSQLVADYMPE